MQEVLDGIGVHLLGCLPRTVDLELPSRHLGLAPAHEIEAFQQRLDAWARLADEHLEMEVLRPLLEAPAIGPDPVQQQCSRQPVETPLSPVPVAVARDQAFHFRYPEMQDWLDALAMPVIPWQPLADEPLPDEACGLILPGGSLSCMPQSSVNANAASPACAVGLASARSTPNAAACCCWGRASPMGAGNPTPWRECFLFMPQRGDCRWATGALKRSKTASCCAAARP